MKRRLKYLALIFILPVFFLTGCIGGGEPFNIQEFMKNPFIMGVILIVTLWYAFTHYGKK